MKGRPDSYLIILYPATNVKSTPQIDTVLIARQEAARIRPDPLPGKKTRRGKNAMLPIADTSRSRRPSCFTSGAMKGRVAWIAAGAVMFVLAALLLAPRTSYQPGVLLEAHAQLSGQCTACHQPWHGPTSQGCINCHGGIDNNSHSGADVTD